MAQTYSVKIVSEKEWEKLHASNPRYANIEDSLGFADPEEGKGYVRQTYWPELNKFLLDHEFEHLLNPEYETDMDEHGIYHKKFFKQVALPVLGAIGGALLGGPLGGVLGGTAGSTIGGVAGAGLGGFGGAKLGGAPTRQALISGGLSAGGQLLAPGISSAVGKAFGGGTQVAANVTPQTVQASRFGITPQTQFSLAPQQSVSSVLKTGITGSQGVPAAGATGLNRFPLGVPRGINPAEAAQIGGRTPLAPPGAPTPPPAFSTTAPVAATTQGGSFLKDLVKTIGTGVAGNLGASALMGAGQSGFDLASAGALTAAGEARQVPQIPNFLGGPLAQQAIQGTRGPTTDVGRLAATRLSDQLNQPFGGLPPDVMSGLQRTYDRQRAQVTSQFKAFRPGADLATDSGYRQAMADIDRQQAEATGNLQLQYQQQFDVNRRADIASAMGMDEQSLNAALQLSQLEAKQIALQAGVDYGTAMQFKQSMGQLAGLFATRGLGLNRFQLDIPQLAQQGTP